MSGILAAARLSWRDPWATARCVAALEGNDGLVLLDQDSDGASTSRWAYLGWRVIRQLRCRGFPGDPQARDPFAELAAGLQAVAHLGGEGPAPFNGGWMGWLAYEAGAWIESRPTWKQPDEPLLWAALHDPLLAFDLRQRQVWVLSHGLTPGSLAGNRALAEQRVAAVGSLWQQLPTAALPSIPVSGRWHWCTEPRRFADQVRQVKRWIAAGDLFQANLSCCCEATLTDAADPMALYGLLRQASPAPFAGLAISAGDAVISASPERFLRAGADGWIETRPIKGTRPRARDPALDADLAVELITSPKDRAENVMIVDLLRNDLGRVCVPGSIRVPVLAGHEPYRQVHHLTSVVEGQLRPDHNVVDLLRACWPGGSISGAPKVRACRRLAELEPVARGPYCGSLFQLGCDGQWDSSIVIRSLMLHGQRLRAHAGCGIVADSDPDAETAEMAVKIAALRSVLSETVCQSPGNTAP